MAGLLDDEELMPFFGNPNIQRQGARARALAAKRDVNTLPDPRTYAAISGLLGQAPDEMGFSVLNPDYEGIQRVARPAFAAGTALGIAPMMRGMNLAPRPAVRAPSAESQAGMIVFHGSPAKFSKFDPAKIGTGEGAQVYGYGHYVAESPEVAKQYKETLKSRAFSQIVRKDRNVYDVVAPDGAVISQGTTLGPASKAKNAYDTNAGSLYEIDLPDEQIARMLNFDQPVDEAIRSRVSQAAMERFGSGSTGTSGELLYKELTREFKNAGSANPAADASEFLRMQEIPGIRYLDQNSRSNFRVQNSVRGKLYGEPVSFMTEQQAKDYATEQVQKGFQPEIIPGTSNFVVFPGNENLLNIKKRNEDLLGLFD